MSKDGNEQTETRDAFRINHRHDEELQWYVREGHDLMSRSALGAQLAAARDNVQAAFVPDWDPTWLLDFSRRSAVYKARLTAVVLWGAQVVYQPAIEILWCYCHPTTVTACDGLYGGPRRLLAVYPLTPTGGVARRKDGRLLVTKSGKRPFDALRQLNADRVQSKGEERKLWVGIRAEARIGLQLAFAAYAISRDFVADFERRHRLMPIRRELEAALGAGRAPEAAE